MPAFRRPAVVTAAISTLAAVAALTTAVLGGASADAAAPVPTAAATFTPKIPGAGTCCGQTFLQPGSYLQSDNLGRSSLESVGLGSGSSNIAATASPFHLSLTAGGDLVEYRTGADNSRTAVWSTGTRSTTPTKLVFQRDGNVVLSNAANTPLWSTGTGGRGAVTFAVYGNGQLVTQDASGKVLSAHGPASPALPGFEVGTALSPSFLAGTSTVYDLRVQSDGNVVQYRRARGGDVAVWSTGTAGVGPVRLVAQSDGNLVLYQRSTNRAVWASGSHGPTAYYQLDLQDDSNLVLYRTDGKRRVQAVWAAGFHR